MRAGFKHCAAIIGLVAGMSDANRIVSAQEALPAIDVGAARHPVIRPDQKTRPGMAPAPVTNVSTPAETVPPPAPQSAELTSDERLERLLPKIGVNDY